MPLAANNCEHTLGKHTSHPHNRVAHLFDGEYFLIVLHLLGFLLLFAHVSTSMVLRFRSWAITIISNGTSVRGGSLPASTNIDFWFETSYIVLPA